MSSTIRCETCQVLLKRVRSSASSLSLVQDITGAADDDPSGIATYSIAGAQLGTLLLWMAFVTCPLMTFVQFMCVRIGMVTGRGLAGALRQICPRWLLFTAATALLIANTITIGADLAGMADAGQMLTRTNSQLLTVLFGTGIAVVICRSATSRLPLFLNGTVALFAYVANALYTKGRLGGGFCEVRSLLHGRVTIRRGRTFVAVLGTAISPYLFFWQASHEVEEEKTKGRRTGRSRRGATKREIIDREVGVGTFFSNLVMYFIVPALSLHTHNQTNVQSSREVAQALEPLAGSFAAALYTLGVIGTGLLAIR